MIGRTRARWLRALAALAVAVLALELFARHVLGLGDPPLYVMDAGIEYLMKPSRTYHRFRNRVAINRWSMRSDDFPKHKPEPSEFRVMVFGDSIMHGGALLDQTEIATERLRADLSSRLRKPVVVGNISAGSWGPPNMLAYAERFGFFDADAVVIVLSSHDYADVPTYQPRDGDWPTRPPLFALAELMTRYLPRYLPDLRDTTPALSARTDEGPPAADVARCLAALERLIRMAKADAVVAIALHLERDESVASPKPGHAALASTADSAGAAVLRMGSRFAQARAIGQEPYRDWIHPTAAGQAIIADALSQWIVDHAATRR